MTPSSHENKTNYYSNSVGWRLYGGYSDKNDSSSSNNNSNTRSSGTSSSYPPSSLALSVSKQAGSRVSTPTSTSSRNRKQQQQEQVRDGRTKQKIWTPTKGFPLGPSGPRPEAGPGWTCCQCGEVTSLRWLDCDNRKCRHCRCRTSGASGYDGTASGEDGEHGHGCVINKGDGLLKRMMTRSKRMGIGIGELYRRRNWKEVKSDM